MTVRCINCHHEWSAVQTPGVCDWCGSAGKEQAEDYVESMEVSFGDTVTDITAVAEDIRDILKEKCGNPVSASVVLATMLLGLCPSRDVAVSIIDDLNGLIEEVEEIDEWRGKQKTTTRH